MNKRHADALLIAAGACNPAGIARTLVAAIDEAMAEPTYTGTDALRADPALRLIVNQLQFLMGNGEMDLDQCTLCEESCRHETVSKDDIERQRLWEETGDERLRG